MKLYIHTGPNECSKLVVDDNSLIGDLIKTISQQLNVPDVEISLRVGARPLQNQTMLISTFLSDGEDVFVNVSAPPPPVILRPPVQAPVVLTPQAVAEIPIDRFTRIERYSFFEVDDWNVRVIVEMPGIGKLPKENYQPRFLERSFEMKIFNYKGKNWIFGSGRLHSKANPEGCRYSLKPDKILITLRKQSDKDNWFTLTKTKMIGGHDSD